MKQFHFQHKNSLFVFLFRPAAPLCFGDAPAAFRADRPPSRRMRRFAIRYKLRQGRAHGLRSLQKIPDLMEPYYFFVERLNDFRSIHDSPIVFERSAKLLSACQAGDAGVSFLVLKLVQNRRSPLTGLSRETESIHVRKLREEDKLPALPLYP
jgi:hypothetical protein